MISRAQSDTSTRLLVGHQSPAASWLVLAADGPAADLASALPDVGVVVVADPARFRALLGTMHPKVVVCSRPPASPSDIGAVVDAKRRRPSVRAILVAPPEAVDARLEALARGFDDALASSVTLDELAGRLIWHDARARTRQGSGSVLRFGDGLELDTAAHVLHRRGVLVHLRPKEYGLLALLAAHPGRAYSRAELLDRVWGGHDRTGRTVDVHVRWLRSKIEADPDRPVMLVTVRGVGYRLDAAAR